VALIRGDTYEYPDGTIVRDQEYNNVDLSKFDLSLLIAKGKGPVKLEIYPDNDISKGYTVTVNYDAVTFSGKAAGTAVADNAKDDFAKPIYTGIPGAGSDHNYNSYPPGVTSTATVGVSKVIAQIPDKVYVAEVTSTGTGIGGGASAIPGGTVAGGPAAQLYANLWDTTQGLDAKTNVITLDFDLTSTSGQIFYGYTGGPITIRQVNPAFVLYEKTVLDAGNLWSPEADPDYAGSYNGNPEFKWSGQGGHIVCKERDDYANFSGLRDFHIMVMDLPDPADEVVVFTFIYTTGTGPVTKSLRIDYSGVKFFDDTH
jgi:hypothetical protein